MRLLDSFDTWTAEMVELLTGPGGLDSFATLIRYEVRIDILRKQLVLKFKLQILDPACEARLHTATSTTLDHYLERVLIADSVAAVFAD